MKLRKRDRATGSTAKKKKKKKRLVLGIVIGAALLIGAVAVASAFSGPGLPTVEVTEVAREDIRATVDASGTVGSTHIKTYYAPVSAPLGDTVKRKGDRVKAGDVLASFDCTTLESDQKAAELERSAAVHANNDALAQNKAKIASAQKARARVKECETQLETYRLRLAELNTKIAERTKAVEAAEGDPATDSTLVSLNNEVASVNAKMEQTQGQLAEAQTASTADETALTSDAIAQLKENSDLASVKAETAAELLKKGKEGVKADFDGIVLTVGGSEGATLAPGYMANQGGELMTVASLKDLAVDATIAKNDVDRVAAEQTATIRMEEKEYAATVLSVGTIAQKNEKGGVTVAAVVKFNEPDADIVYGSEAKVVIDLPVIRDALVIPIEAVNIAKDGSFVYLLNQVGIVEKRAVETGTSADGKMEILGGLKAGEKVITVMPEGLEAGMGALAAEETE